MIRWLTDHASRMTHDALCRCGVSRSWCACAYACNRRALVWILDTVFHRFEKEGDHCRRAAEFYGLKK